MEKDERPLSALVGQGWEIVGYASGHVPSGAPTENVLLRRQKQHKILSLRRKTFGAGYIVKEFDL